jgi:hypothetical protein
MGSSAKGFPFFIFSSKKHKNVPNLSQGTNIVKKFPQARSCALTFPGQTGKLSKGIDSDHRIFGEYHHQLPHLLGKERIDAICAMHIIP